MIKYGILFLAVVALIAAGCTKSTTEPMPTNQPVQESPNPTTGNTNAGTQEPGITMAQVQAANTEDKCWTVIRGEVYNLTDWIATHPGGSAGIVALCGKDGTQAFMGQHGGMAQQEAQLAKFKIGTLAQ